MIEKTFTDYRNDFSAAVRGIPTNHVTKALTLLTPGLDWSRSSKALMAESYAASMVGHRAGHFVLRRLELGKLALLARARADGIDRWFDVNAVHAERDRKAAIEKTAKLRDSAGDLLAALEKIAAMPAPVGEAIGAAVAIAREAIEKAGAK